MYQNPYQMQFMPPYPYGQTLRNTYGNDRDFYSQQMNGQQQQNMYAPQQPMQIQTNIEYVNGIEGAKAFMLPPNAQKLLLDSDNPFFYIKTTDQQGKPVVKRFKYIDVDADQQAQQQDTQPQAKPNPLYVTLEQYQDLMDMVDVMRQEIDTLKASKTKKTAESEVKK